MLDDVLPALACPVCGAPLSRADRSVRCARGHAFDVAKQGYLSLLTGRGGPEGDSPAMVAARTAFLDAGHFAPLSTALAASCADAAGPGGLVLEVGAGTGHHLAAVLDALPTHTGLALDVAKHALRRAARAHPRIGSVAADAWASLPVRDGAADLVLDVFAPRNGAEWHRVLRPGGSAVVATPAPEHLGELVGALGLLTVDPHKDERLAAALGEWFTEVDTARVEVPMRLDHAAVRTVVAMGPSARHLDPADLDARVAALPAEVTVTGAVVVRRFVRR